MASSDDVRKLAALARLSIPEEALPARAAEFDRIVSYIGELDELELETKSAPAAPAYNNVFRTDGEPTPSGTWTERLVSLFPQRDGDYLSVKKIISHE